MDSQTFYKQLQQNSEGFRYLYIINEIKSLNRGLERENGFEIHHIHTRALGGTNDNDNLVKLSVYEHILVHYYLALALPCRETLYPIIILSNRAVKSLTDIQKVSIESLEHWTSLQEKANRALLGRICINNGQEKKYVFEEELKEYLAKGWLKGNLPTTKGRVTMNLNGKDIKVVPESAVEYEEAGWQLGSCRKGTVRDRTQKIKGLRKFMTNGIEELQVLTEDQQGYLNIGWKFGRKPFSSETREKLSVAARNRYNFIGKTEEGALRRHITGLGRIWCHLGSKSRWVSPDVFEELEKQGWIKGRKTKLETTKVKSCRKPVSEETRRKQSEARKGRKVSIETLNKMKAHRWVQKDGVQLRIVCEDLQKYLENGWLRGRYSTTTKGLKSIYSPDTGIKKYVTEKELEFYIQDGWKPGHPATNLKRN